MITPATGIKPSKKIINAKPNNCGNPNIHNAITERTQLTTAIKNCASITFQMNVQISFRSTQFQYRKLQACFL